MIKPILDQKYSDLCTKLGDLSYRIGILSDEKEQVLREIKSMDAITPLLVQLEQQAKSAVQNAKA